MYLEGYLIVKKVKFKGSARFVQKKPALNKDEISIAIYCNIPDELFLKPQLSFNITVPKEAVPKKEISAEVVGNIQQIIQQNLGIEVQLISPNN